MHSLEHDDFDFETYVQELLQSLPKGLTLAEFRERCKPDINGGWVHEVHEAERRYFKRPKRAR